MTMKNKTIISILFLLFAMVSTLTAGNRNYVLDKSFISNVNFKTKYAVKVGYTLEGATQVFLLPGSDFRFGGFTDAAGYVKEITVNETTLYIEFNRRDTASMISGNIELLIKAKPESGATEMKSYTLTLQYSYPLMNAVDPGEISGPAKFHAAGERPATLNSLYEAIPLTGTITYSWEKKSAGGVWGVIENANSSTLLPDAVGTTPDYYRRRATDGGGNSACSNIVEILPMFDAGKIGLNYADTDNTLTLTNTVSPTLSEATLGWQSTTNLETWNTIPGSTKSLSVPKPSATTYYRRVVTSSTADDNGNPIVMYSNMVCYNTGVPAGIASKSYWGSDSAFTDIEYVDGLGRRMQLVAKSATPAGEDVVIAYNYDNKGRETGVTVPFSIVGDGNFVRNALYKSQVFHNDNYALTQQLYDNSPLDRPVGSYRPGAVYQGAETKHCSTLEYDVNAEGELLKLTHTAGGFVVAGTHPAATLRKTLATDEDGTTVTIFTDALGKTLLERRAAGDGQYADTYFVYDAKGRLSTVVSPQGSAMLTPGTEYSRESALVKDYCYIYSYDNDDRLTMKRLPGGCAQYFEYDTNGRLTVSYDDEMLQSGVKKHYAYDALGREVGFRYASDKGACCQQRNLYDNYDTNCHRFVEVNGIVTKNDTASAKGKLTYDRTFEIFSDYASEVRERTYYYDKRGRCVQIVTSHPMGFSCRTSVKYDYAGNPLKTLEEYSGRTNSIAILTECTFDSRGRKLTEQTSVNGTIVGSAAFTYDEQGRVTRTLLGDKINMTAVYNLQGWLTDNDGYISTDGYTVENVIFKEKLRYYAPLDDSSTPCYAGKISEQECQRKLKLGGNDRFVYHYDTLGRLSSANHRITGLGQSTAGSYSENLTYDLAGNIIAHNAEKDGVNSRLSYTYNGNHIASVTHNNAAIGTAQYDSRGNITKIPGENLQIAYNLCNLPQSITTDDGATVNYSYLSDGTKFRAVSDSGEKYLYAGSLRFRIDGDNNIVPESFPIAGGRVIYNGGSWMTNYYITDHLGSVRAVTDANGNVLATFDYTPYGELLAATDNTTAGTDHLFTGKEQQGKLGVSELYDSHARFMNTTGRFLSMDPLAEKYYHLSPYAYCAGDPVNFVDPDGRMYGDFVDKKGRIIGTDGIDDGKVYVHKISKWQFFRSYQVGSKHSWRSLRKAKKFVEMNSGNTEAFMRTPEVYDCFVEIVGDRNMRQAMVSVVEKDDGKYENRMNDNNRREYGGYILNNMVYDVPPGEVGKGTINIRIREEHTPFITNKEKWLQTFHSHPSGLKSDNEEFVQYPILNDIEISGSFTSYVFARKESIVYIYNGNGILSKIPHKRFVNFKN